MGNLDMLCNNSQMFAAGSGFGVAYLQLDRVLPLPPEVHWTAAGIASVYLCKQGTGDFSLTSQDTMMAAALGFAGGMIAMRMR